MGIVKFRLMLQNFQEKLGFKIAKKAREAQKRGEDIFGINTHYLLERAGSSSNFPLQTCIESLGNYDFKNDIVRIFYRRIEYYCETYDVDLDSTFCHVVCHEMGHSKEARIFEEANIFPYRFNVFRFRCPLAIDSQTLDLNRIRIAGIGFYEIFRFGIDNYGINQELKKHGMTDPLSKIPVQHLLKIRIKDLTKEQRHELIVQSLLLLPHYVDLFVNGGLTRGEKEVLENYHKNLVGDKWKFTLEIMNDLEFGKPERYADIMCKLFENILGQRVFQSIKKSKNLFDRYRTIPRFWANDSYKVFYLTPKEMG